MSKIELLFREGMAKKLEEIKQNNPKATIWSHSRLGNFKQCKKQYYHTYVDKKEQKTGIYSCLGSSCHDSLEEVYDSKVDRPNKQIFDNEFLKCELFGINFPKSKYDIKGGYKKDIDAFYDVYKKIDGEGKKFISEIGFILKLDEDHYEIGYIDLLILNDDGTAEVIDFKTSSTFDAKHTVSAGRQLVLYKIAIEQLYGIKVNTVAWEMLKYIDVQVGDNKPKIALKGREWVAKCSSQVKTLMKKEGIDSSLIDLYMSKCEADNNINCLPEEIRNKIKVNIHTRYYEVTDEIIEECLEYTRNTIKEIEAMDTEGESKWECSVDKFFCCNLCGFGGTHCRYWEIEDNK